MMVSTTAHPFVTSILLINKLKRNKNFSILVNDTILNDVSLSEDTQHALEKVDEPSRRSRIEYKLKRSKYFLPAMVGVKV